MDASWSTSLVQNLRKCWQHGFFCDTLMTAADGGQFCVHACVLAAASPILQEQLLAQPDGQMKSISTSIDRGVLHLLLESIYGGDLNIEDSDLPSLVEGASKLGLGSTLPAYIRGGVCSEPDSGGSNNANSTFRTKRMLRKRRGSKPEPDIVPGSVPREKASAITKTPAVQHQESTRREAETSGRKRSRKTTPIKRVSSQQFRGQINKDDSIGAWENHLASIKEEELSDCEEDVGDRNELIVPPMQIKKETMDDEDLSTDCPGSSTLASAADPEPSSAKSDKKYLCSVCDASFMSRSTLVAHQTIHEEGDQKFKCPECPLSFRMNSSLASHIRSHMRSQVFRCRHCGRDFQEKCGLFMHQLKCKPPYNCQKCEESFMDVESLQNHEKTHVLPSTIHKCELCGWVSARKYLLDIHMKTHSSKPLQCTYCNVTFQRQRDLNNHKKFHTRKK